MSGYKFDKLLGDLRESDGWRNRGDYDGGISYLVDDVVAYNGSTYICIQTSTGNLPTDNNYWHIVAQMGDPGISGISGSSVTPFMNETTVVVTHNFNAYPAVQVINDSGVLLEDSEITSITHNSVNQLTIVFPGSTSGNVICTIGGVSTKYVTKSGDYTLTDEDNTVSVTDTATMTLPSATGRQGQTQLMYLLLTLKEYHFIMVLD